MALAHYLVAVPVETSKRAKTSVLTSSSSSNEPMFSLALTSSSLLSKARNLSIFPRIHRIIHKAKAEPRESEKEALPEHETQLASVRWHLSQGGFQEFKLLERLGEGSKPTAIIADDLNLDLVVMSMEGIHSKQVDANLLA